MKTQTFIIVGGLAVVGYFYWKKQRYQTELAYVLQSPQIPIELHDVIQKMTPDEVHILYTIAYDEANKIPLPADLVTQAKQILAAYGVQGT